MMNLKNKFVGQVCHIEAAMPGGERFNENQTDEDRRSYENLLLLCYQHHIETDDVEEFTVQRMTEMKLSHEALFEKSDFKINESELHKLISDMQVYWEKIERVNGIEHTMEELAFKINVKGNFSEIFQNARQSVTYISELLERLCVSDLKLMEDFKEFIQIRGIDPSIFDDVPYYENPFDNRNWENHNLSAPNNIIRINLDLLLIEVKFLEEYLKTNSGDRMARNRLETAKAELEDMAQNSIMYD